MTLPDWILGGLIVIAVLFGLSDDPDPTSACRVNHVGVEVCSIVEDTEPVG